MSERLFRDSDITELKGKSLREVFGFRPFDKDYAIVLALLLKESGAKRAVPVKTDEGFFHEINGYFPEGVKVEIYAGVHTESVDVILSAQLDNYDSGEEIVGKLRRMMRRWEILEDAGYTLRGRKAVRNDSRPLLDEKRFYRMAFSKPLDTHKKDRVTAEIKQLVAVLFSRIDEAQDPDPEI